MFRNLRAVCANGTSCIIFLSTMLPASIAQPTDLDVGSESIGASAVSRIDYVLDTIDRVNAEAVYSRTPGEISETGERDDGTRSGPAAWLTYTRGGPAAAGVSGGTCAINVGLLGAESLASRFTDVTDKIIFDSRIATVTAIDVRLVTPTVAHLNAFDVVMVWSDFSFANSVLLGDRLATYVDGGGGVVVSMFALRASSGARTLEGRFLSDNYYCIERLIGSSTTGTATLGTVLVPGHPVMSGVTSFDGGTVAARTSNPPHPFATRIANWSDGNVLAASRYDLNGRRVDLAFWPVSSDEVGTSW